MGIHIAEQMYDKKKNKLSVSVQIYFRVNFVKSVMFFEKKIKTEAIEQTKKMYDYNFIPVIIQYLAKLMPRFVRPIPKIKKKLTKADKLLVQIDDMQTEQEEEILALKKDFDKQLSTLKQTLEDLNEQHDTLTRNVKMIAGVVLVAMLFYMLYAFI
jgi:methyl-accepting chemotaxis protein